MHVPVGTGAGCACVNAAVGANVLVNVRIVCVRDAGEIARLPVCRARGYARVRVRCTVWLDACMRVGVRACAHMRTERARCF